MNLDEPRVFSATSEDGLVQSFVDDNQNVVEVRVLAKLDQDEYDELGAAIVESVNAALRKSQTSGAGDLQKEFDALTSEFESLMSDLDHETEKIARRINVPPSTTEKPVKDKRRRRKRKIGLED